MLVGIVVLATLTVLIQLFDTYRSTSIRWTYQWLPNVGVSHIIVCLILGVFVYLWAPHSASDVYAYSEQLGHEAEGVNENIVHAVDGEEHDEAYKRSTNEAHETITTAYMREDL